MSAENNHVHTHSFLNPDQIQNVTKCSLSSICTHTDTHTVKWQTVKTVKCSFKGRTFPWHTGADTWHLHTHTCRHDHNIHPPTLVLTITHPRIPVPKLDQESGPHVLTKMVRSSNWFSQCKHTQSHLWSRLWLSAARPPPCREGLAQNHHHHRPGYVTPWFWPTSASRFCLSVCLQVFVRLWGHCVWCSQLQTAVWRFWVRFRFGSGFTVNVWC